MTTNTDYHHVFIPFPDIFELSGSDVFDNLQAKPGNRNLVVVAMPMVNWLDELKESHNSVGASDTLQYLKEAQRKTKQKGDDIAICSMSEGLDIAFINDPKLKDEDFITPLEEKVRSLWKAQDSDGRPILMTNRERDHIRFRTQGMRVDDPHFLQVKADIVDKGIITGDHELLAKLYESTNGTIDLETAQSFFEEGELRPNQFIRFTGDKDYVYARVMGNPLWNGNHSRMTSIDNVRVKLLDTNEYGKKLSIGETQQENILGIAPRDMEQYLAMQYGLLNPDVSLFFLCGSQGSGKTLLGYVCAVDQVLIYEQKERTKRKSNPTPGKTGFFKQIILLKPNEVLGGKRRDVGALPGTLYDKLKPHLAPYIDAHRESQLGRLFPFDEMLRHPHFENDFGPKRSDAASNTKINECAYLPKYGEVVEMTYSGFMRGRSFRDSLVLLDEAQNFTPYEVKTILERTGEGCKVVVMGDPKQVDNPFCSREINGLTHALQQYLDRPYVGLITLSRNYRSQMSDDARDWKVFSQS